MFVNVFLVVGDDRFGDGLPDCVDLRSVSTAGDPDADVDLGEFIEANDEEWFINLWGISIEGR